MATVEQTKFSDRFDRIWAQARWVQLSQAVCWAILVALAGVALLAAADYWLELPISWRIGGIILTGLTSLGVAIYLAFESIRRWQRVAMAAAIERFFPQLGQRIRTTLQYGELSSDEIHHAGVASPLVKALEDDTVAVARPLPLDAVIPWRSLALASLLAAVVGLCLAGLSAFDWQWRAAASRAFLADNPYTSIQIKPGDISVKEHESVTVEIVVGGRVGREVVFSSRRLDDDGGQWRDEALTTADGKDLGDHRLAFELPLDRIRHPLEYRVSAGSAISDTYQVAVLYPLKLRRIETTITSPQYTRLPQLTVVGSSIAALVGSKLDVAVELDREPAEAWLEIKDLTPKVKGEEIVAERVPLIINGNKLTASLEVTTDKTFSVVAKSADGMELVENKHRIRARKDEPPQVWFESPSEALEVHTLAEVMMRIRVADDFGLSRAGIMFEVNNEEEYPLLLEDFEKAMAELKKTGKLSANTRQTLERVLPLEHFQLTQQDSVMYYAFAEDTRPSGTQRTETDLRFIDIRPFKREYRVPPDADGMPQEGNNRVELKSLEELISRQRYALNRAIQLQRKFKHTQQTDLAGTDSLIKFEGELAKSTRELAEGLNARGIDDTELLYQAETSMLAATDSLSAGKFSTSELQMRDALKSLIEGRDRLRILISKNRNRQQLAQLRQFDRMQQQKLRKPKSDEEEAKELAQRLEQLAQQENNIGGQLASAQRDMEKEGDQPMKAEKPSDEEPMENQKPTARDIEDRQQDAALEARELEKVLNRLPKATDLAKQRMADAAKSTEDAAAAIGRKELKEAEKTVETAEKQLNELAEQVRALVAEEQAERIAAAQKMAAELAKKQEDFVDKLANAEGSGGPGNKPPMKEDEPMSGGEKGSEKMKQADKDALGAAAQEIADKAETLKDVLGSTAKADTPQEEATAEKIQELIKSLGLDELANRLKGVGEQIKNDQLEDAKATGGDAAERFEAAAEQLGNLHRGIIAPRVAELSELDKKLEQLEGGLDELNTDQRVTGWHSDADDVLEDLEKAGISPEDLKQFEQDMKKAGWGELRRGGWNWVRNEAGILQAPQVYRAHIARLSAAVRDRMQELILGDHVSSGDEPIPPQYEALVDRYYEVLAGQKEKEAKEK
jgi:hypothetical protein